MTQNKDRRDTEGDRGREVSGPPKLLEGESDSDPCVCDHPRNGHAGGSRCAVVGCGCAKFRSK